MTILPLHCCGVRLSKDKGALEDQLEELLGRHLLTKNKDGHLVPLAKEQRILHHAKELPPLTAEQEEKLFAPVDEKIKRMAILQPDDTQPPAAEAENKTNISKEMAQINNKSCDSHIDSIQRRDMRKGGIVRKYTR